MKKILVFLTLCLHIEFFAQQCPMTYTGTDSNATIAITQDALSNFYLTDGVNTIPLSEIQCPIEIGVFYVPFTNGNTSPLCTGSSSWSNDENFAIAAWSDDSTTPEIDGMPQGSPFFLVFAWKDLHLILFFYHSDPFKLRICLAEITLFPPMACIF